MQETLGKFICESAKRHKENSNTIKEIQASTDAAVRNQGASIKTLEIEIGQISKVLHERGLGSLPSSTKANSRDHVKSILTNVEADSNPIRPYSYGASHIDNSIPRKEKDPRSFTLPCYINNVFFDNALADLRVSISFMPLLTYLNFGLGELARLNFIIIDMPEDVKVPLILRRPFLSTAHAKIDVFKRKITLRVRDDKIIFKCIKPASSLIKRVYMLCLRERVELDLEARLMGETLVLNRSLDPLYGDYIELNDLNVPLELRRDQVDDLIPTFEEGKIIMVNVIPPDHVDDVPIVELNQNNDVPAIPEPVLVDEDEDPEEEEFEEEEEPQEEEEDDIEVDHLNPPPPAFESEPKDVIEVEDTVESKDETDPASVHEVGELSTAPFLQEDNDGLLPGLIRRNINSLFGRMASLLRRLCGLETAHALVKKKGKSKDEYYAKCKKLKKELEEARSSNTLLRMQNKRVERDLYWTRVLAHELLGLKDFLMILKLLLLRLLTIEI
ncbi:hypothetical protein Tco_1316064 [Tanacetum coccineum]